MSGAPKGLVEWTLDILAVAMWIGQYRRAVSRAKSPWSFKRARLQNGSIRPPPEPLQRSVLSLHRIAVRQPDLRNRFQRPAMIFGRRPRDVHFGSGRIGADDAEIPARGEALMPGAGGAKWRVARGTIDILRTGSTETDPRTWPGAVERLGPLAT